MPTYSTKSKKEEVSKNKPQNKQSTNSGASLSSPVSQLFKFEKENQSNDDETLLNTKELKSAPSFPTIEINNIKNVQQNPVSPAKSLGSHSAPVQLMSIKEKWAKLLGKSSNKTTIVRNTKNYPSLQEQENNRNDQVHLFDNPLQTMNEDSSTSEPATNQNATPSKFQKAKNYIKGKANDAIDYTKTKGTKFLKEKRDEINYDKFGNLIKVGGLINNVAQIPLSEMKDPLSKIKKPFNFINEMTGGGDKSTGGTGGSIMSKIGKQVGKKVAKAGEEMDIGETVLDGLSIGKNGFDLYRGRKQRKEAQENLKNKAQDLNNDEVTADRVKNRIAATEGWDKQRNAVYGIASKGLNLAGNITAASGVAAPVGFGLKLAGKVVSKIGSLHNMSVQSGRDKEARRVRSMDEIGQDRVERNIAREKKIKGSSFNPMNWGAKISRKTGFLDSAEKKIGTDAGKNNEEALENYKQRKREKYSSEGYNYDKFDGDASAGLTKDKKVITKSNEGGLFNRFSNKSKEQSYNIEDIMVKKGLSSKEAKERKKEEMKNKKYFSI